MQARLFSKTGKTRDFELTFEGEATIGRDAQSNLVIDQPLMSSRHARIAYDTEGGRYVLEDLGSLNGTELDGDAVSGPERLGHLHVITFAGTYDFFFQDVERCKRRHPSSVASTEAPTAETEAVREEAPEAETAPKTASEKTAIDHEPLEMPGFLARRADAISGQSTEAGTPKGPGEITSIDHEPAALPAALGRRADAEREGAAQGAADEATADDSPAKDPADLTRRQKLPVELPDILAQRARQAETLDLDDIEELLAADSSIEDQDTADDEPVGLHLIVTEPDGGVRRLGLQPGENLIGRSSSVQVPMAYPDLSRRHAVLTVGDRVTLRDLRSRNRTFVDDRPLEPEVDTEVQTGARLRFGSIEARLVDAGSDEEMTSSGSVRA
ncbi:MAG: FHA domain-containing protein [Acidobacteriota bacterium]